MATRIRINKVNELPLALEPSALYMVKGVHPDHFEFHVASSDGLSTRHVINKAEIQAMIDNTLSGFNTVNIAANIAERDAMVPVVNTQVLVLDATGDPTVLTGAATYIYNVTNTTWFKITEYESLDVTMEWSKLVGKPVSSVASIDQAVEMRHAHANLVTLDKLGENASGELTYNNNPVRIFLDEETW